VTEYVGGIPYYFQKLGVGLERDIVVAGKRRIGAIDVEDAFSQLLDELAGDFQERWETRFSDQQRAVLKVLSQGPMSVTEAARALEVAPSNISYSLSRLTEAMVLTKEERRYRITDRVFAAWLKDL
jgi:DNA-binding transcriptional ArsR family regulator